MPTRLPTPPADRDGAVAWVRDHLADLCAESPAEIAGSAAFAGGQTAADAALALFDVAGYAGSRNEVLPPERRGASRLSPYIRHGLLPLPRVWGAVAGGPARDVRKFRDELLWQEYARHLYARVGARSRRALRYDPPAPDPDGARRFSDEPWPRDMACVDAVLTELETDGWMVNQTRMWLASQWTVRAGWDWPSGEDRFFTHLLDGSRAANRLGWQWTVGAGTGKAYGFSRSQVRKRAPGLCDTCALRDACPIEQWPQIDAGAPVGDEAAGLRADPDARRTAGPAEVWRAPDADAPRAVWITAESLGDEDPALASHPDLPVVFVLDRALLDRWRLSSKRLVFLGETLGDLAGRRDLEVHLGDPVAVLSGRALAATVAPVPGWRRRARAIGVAEAHPWPWLVPPHDGRAQSFSAWRRAAKV